MLTKKEPFDYFQRFVDYADCAVRAAVYLKETVDHFDPAALSVRMDELHRIEHEADQLNHVTLDHLAREFLPPIEREDIVALSQEFDDVVDDIDDIMRRMGMYGVTRLRPEAAEFCELLVRSTQALKDLTEEFRHFKKSKNIREHLVRVNSLETEGDTLHYRAVQRLFASPATPLDTIVWKDIFDDFERCCDNCEDVGGVISSVVFKNS